jgi:hypothetical protein
MLFLTIVRHSDCDSHCLSDSFFNFAAPHSLTHTRLMMMLMDILKECLSEEREREREAFSCVRVCVCDEN